MPRTEAQRLKHNEDQRRRAERLKAEKNGTPIPEWAKLKPAAPPKPEPPKAEPQQAINPKTGKPYTEKMRRTERQKAKKEGREPAEWAALKKA
jgi:hypothetical protein